MVAVTQVRFLCVVSGPGWTANRADFSKFSYMWVDAELEEVKYAPDGVCGVKKSINQGYREHF